MPDLKKIVERFREIQPKFSRLYTRMLAQAGLTQPQYAVLLELAQSAAPVSMTAVSCKLHISKPAVTSLVDRLEKNAFLKRLDHPSDRRVSLLQILAPGKKIVEKIQAQFLGVMMEAAKQFSAEDRHTVEKFYSSLSGSLDKVLDGPKDSPP